MPSILSRTLFAAFAIATAGVHARAQSLTGTIVDPTGNGLAGISVSLDQNGGTQLTNALGVFTFPVLQNRTYAVTILPPTSQWGPRQLSFRVNGASNLGVVTLQPAANVTGIVLGPNGLPLANANLDAIVGGTTLFTPGDGTNVAGVFSVTIPLGVTTIRINPPTGQSLIRFETVIDITGALNMGTITLPQGFALTGTVADATTGLPVGSTRITAFNNITGVEIPQVNPLANSLGAFSLLLPFGIHRLEFDPPTGNTHVGRVLHGVIVLGPTPLGIVRLPLGVVLSGSVSGPGGPTPNCDIDILDATNFKLFTLHDNTDANGNYSVVVPPGTYRVRVDTPPALGLVGTRSALQTFGASDSFPPIALQAGMPFQLAVLGPNGPEPGADLDFFDAATGEPIIIAGDKADANGLINATVPSGVFDIGVDAVQGSLAAPFRIQAPIFFPIAVPLPLAPKQVMVNLTAPFGILTIGQGGNLYVDVRLRNNSASTVQTLIEIYTLLPGGTEIVFPQLPLDLPPGLDFTLPQLLLPTVPVPASETGRELRYYLRVRNPAQQVLDQAYIEFVVQ